MSSVVSFSTTFFISAAALLLLAPTEDSVGYAGRGDFAMLPDGRLRRRGEGEVVPFVYAGAAMLAPALFTDAPSGAFSLTLSFSQLKKFRFFARCCNLPWKRSFAW